MTINPALPHDSDGKLSSYAWPGGYPIFYLDGDNSVLCPACANKSNAEDEIDRFKPVAADVNWEAPDLYCDNCNKRIESADAEPE